MQKPRIAAILLCAGLGGCASLPGIITSVESAVSSDVAAVQSATEAACEVVPTADTLTNLIQGLYGDPLTALGVTAIEGLANDICNAAKSQVAAGRYGKSRMRGAVKPNAPVVVDGVTIKFL